MKTKPPSETTWPPAWQTANGLSIVDFVLSEARGRGLACVEIEAAAVADPRSRNQLTIAGHRCQVLPGRVLDPDEGHGEGMLRLHPAFEWATDFLIYVVKGSDLFVLPANEATIRGAWAIDARSIGRYKEAWQALGRVAHGSGPRKDRFSTPTTSHPLQT